MLCIGQLVDIDWVLFKVIIDKIENNISIFLSLVMNIGLLFRSAIFFHLVSIKLVIILMILCTSTHWNNSNYLSIFFNLYLYSVSTEINAIILFNYFEFLALHKILLKKLEDSTKASAA